MNTKMTPIKRTLPVLLTLIMAFFMVQLTIFAEGGNVAQVTVGDVTTAYSDFADAVAYANQSADSTLTLLEDVALTETGDMPITGNVTLDLNAKTISGSFIVEAGNKLTLCDSKGGGSVGGIKVNGGVLVGTGGTIDTLTVAGTTSDVQLSGGNLGRVINSTGSFFDIGNLLADGYAIRYTDGKFINRDARINTNSNFTSNAQPVENLTVTSCVEGEHSNSNGTCCYCGKEIVALIGIVNYNCFTTLNDAITYALQNEKLYANVNLCRDVKVDHTISLDCSNLSGFHLELNGYTLSNTTACTESIIELMGGKLEIRSDSTGGLVANGVDGVVVTGGMLTMTQGALYRANGEGCAAIRVRGGSLNLSYGSVLSENGAYAVVMEGGKSLEAQGRGTFGAVKIAESYTGTVSLMAGTYGSIEVEGDAFPTVDTLLGGYCYFTNVATGERVDSNVASVANVSIVHYHEYDEEGMCKADGCFHRAEAKISGTGDETLDKHYDTLEEALIVAKTHEGCTLIVWHSVAIDSAGVTIDSGNFVLEFGEYGSFTDQTGSHPPFILKITGGNIEITGEQGLIGTPVRSDQGTVALVIEGGHVTISGNVKLESHDGVTVDYAGGTLTLNGGSYLRPEDRAMFRLPEGKTCADLLATGYIFADESGNYIPPDQVESCMTVQVIACTEHIWNGNGKCTKCASPCPHGGENDREASYFEKAICSICHSEYGDYVKDTIAPTGEIKIAERTWWQSLLNTISFDLFYKKEVKVEITAADDGYTQPGYDAAKHAVKIEYLTSAEALSEEAVKASNFTEYTGAITLSNDGKYVIYVKLTDYAGNVAYASTDGFVIDTTPPEIEVYVWANGQTKRCKNGDRIQVCGNTRFTFIDDNIDNTYNRIIDGVKSEMYGTSWGVNASETDYVERWITLEVHDKAGNISTVEVYVHKDHSFDWETGVCAKCGYQATVLIKYVNKDLEEKIAFGDSYAEATGMVLNLQDTETGTLKLFGDAEKEGYEITIGSGKWIYDLNGYSITNPKTVDPDSRNAIFWVGCDMTIIGAGTMNVYFVLGDGSLTVDGACTFPRFKQYGGILIVNSGSFESFTIANYQFALRNPRETVLYGGKYGKIEIVDIEGLTCADLLGRGYCFEDVNNEVISYEDAKKVTELSNVTVEQCYHKNLGLGTYCPDCGTQFVVAVVIGNTERLFDTFERAIRYAEENDGCTVKLLQDITLDETMAGSLKDGYRIYLEKGRYTLDLAGKTLDINDEFCVREDCNLTISDSVGGGKVISSSDMGSVYTGYYSNSNAKLTITGGEFTVNVTSFNQTALVLEGGSFEKYVISARGGSPFVYLADGYTFGLLNPAEGKNYANEENVETDHDGSQIIKVVTVVPAPLIIPVPGQPKDTTIYLTSPDDQKVTSGVMGFYQGGTTENKISVILEKVDGKEIVTAELEALSTFLKVFDIKDFTEENSGQYRIKLEFSGYVLYTNTFTITVAVCEHPGYDENNQCAQCGCDLAAAVVKDGKTTGYVDFAEALAAAQTDENKGCTLKLFADVSGTVGVDTGDFGIDLNGNGVGGLMVKKSAKVNVSGGTIKGGVTVAKAAQLTASNTYFTGAINCVGSGDFKDCIFMGSVSAKDGMKLKSCEIHGAFSVSGNAEAEECIVSGTVTVNNGGSLKSTGGTYGNTVNVKSGGTLEIISGTYENKLTAEEGSTLIISGGSHTEVAVENNVDFTINGGKFTHITVNGQHLIDCLAEGKALKDTNINEVIDGRVGIAGHVQVVDHTHTCVWKTKEHIKLCGCGFVEDSDFEAPKFVGVDDNGSYYGDKEFTVTDDNEFTLTIDGETVTLDGGKYTITPDNREHTLVATDVAGNTTTITIKTFKLYSVTKPVGTGYEFVGISEARHGQTYRFIYVIGEGYSKVPGQFKVLVNGVEVFGDENDKYVIENVSGDLKIEIFGVADITPPEVEATIGTNKFNSFMNTVTFGLFFKKTQTVTVSASDAGSGVSKVEYLLSESVFATKEAIPDEWTELTFANGQASFDIKPNQKAFVYVRVTDASGNITVINSDGVVVYTDAKAYSQTQTIIIGSDFDMGYSLVMNGNTVFEVYNGTEKLNDTDYSVSPGGGIFTSFTLRNSYLSTLAAGEYTFSLIFKPMGESYVDNSGNDAPAEVFLKLTVEKKTPRHDHVSSDGKNYDGNPIKATFNTDSDGTLTIEYKKADEDDTAYTTEAPKNAGKYTVRFTTAETNTYKALSSTMEFEIQPKEVKIADVTVSGKIYDGTTDAEITSNGSIVGLIGNDEVSIEPGKATFTDKNVGTGKSVSFTGFALTGEDVANYELTAQPASVTADISAKELTIGGLRVKDKQYDGKNIAEIDGTPVLIGVVDGDVLTLLPGTPTFDSVTIGNEIPISFTEFALFGDSETIGNYTLKQPSGITANITEYVSDGSEYSVNSNDWINTDFVITAKDGYLLSFTAEDGTWTETLTATEESVNGKLNFYVKKVATGAISAVVAESYRIDRTKPTQNGLEDGKTYCSAVSFTAQDENGILAVTVNGSAITAVDGKYTIYPASGVQRVVVTDLAGNTLEISVTVNDDHIWNGDTCVHCGTVCGHVEATAATCHTKAVCGICGSEYGDFNPNNHEGGTEVRDAKAATCTEDGYTGDTYCKGCQTKLAAGTVTNALGHTGGRATCHAKAVCDTCGNAYGELDPNNHEGGTEVRDAKAATCTKDGYTGDTYCKGCQTKLAAGTVTNALGHTGGRATCHAKAVCDTCGNAYGELDPNNHEGGTEVRDAKAATCTEDGYTGDTYCKGCQTKLAAGNVTNALGHTGGKATCHAKAVCDTCGNAYGELDPNNHEGGTEVRDAKAATCTEDGYTGDTYCKGCQAKLAAGTVTNALGHTGGKATCHTKAVCDTCGNAYGELNPNNHEGGTEVRDAKAATCTEDGYTGDTYCKGCRTKLAAGNVTNALGHTGGRATCHTKAICDVCGSRYGSFVPKNHTGGTEVRNAKAATCTEEGYTGDTCCKGCGAKLAEGEVISAPGHKGGKATCHTKAICEVCGASYGTTDAANHEGSTAVRGVKTATCTEDGYTGDTYCTGCNQTLVGGTKIAATGHKGGVATCSEKAICDICHAAYGEKDPNHHANLKKVDAVPASVTERGNTDYYYCDACEGYFRDGEASEQVERSAVILEKLPPEMIEGIDGLWKAGSSEDLLFRSNAAFADFLEVLVDGNVLGSENYTAREGSIIVELKASYLKTLEAGKHTMVIRSESGEATTFFVVEASEVIDILPVADHTWIYIVLVVALVGAGAAVAVVLIRKKRKV